MWRTGRSETFLYVQEPTEAMWEVQAPFQTSAAQQWVRTQRALRAPGQILWKERTTLVVLYLSIFFSEQILAYPFKRNNGFSSMLWNLLPFKSKGTCCLTILLSDPSRENRMMNPELDFWELWASEMVLRLLSPISSSHEMLFHLFSENDVVVSDLGPP